MRRLVTGGVLLLLVGRLGPAAVAQGLPNEVRNPAGTLSVLTPTLLQPGGRVDSSEPQPGQWEVIFSDDLCRQFMVIEAADTESDGTLEARIRERFVPALEQGGALGLELQMVSLEGVGPAAFLRFRQAAGAPCIESTTKDGQVVRSQPDADVVAYAFLRNGYRYTVSYWLGDMPNRVGDAAFGVRTAPATEVLDAFMRELTFSSAALSFTPPTALAGQNVGYSLEQFVADAKSGAERGDVRAQTMLGMMYESGFGVSPDPAKAFEWFSAAANRDDPTGQSLVGRAYADGRGVPPNEDEALVWFHKGAQSGLREFLNQPIVFVGGFEGAIKAAESGDGLFAQLTVGVMYLTGHGVEQNDTEAVRWLAKVAGQELGGAEAKVSLALMYEQGRGGLPMDKAEAMRLYRKAAEQGVEGTKSVLTFFCLSTYARADCGRAR